MFISQYELQRIKDRLDHLENGYYQLENANIMEVKRVGHSKITLLAEDKNDVPQHVGLESVSIRLVVEMLVNYLGLLYQRKNYTEAKLVKPKK